jgi:hypothetical protein
LSQATQTKENIEEKQIDENEQHEERRLKDQASMIVQYSTVQYGPI